MNVANWLRPGVLLAAVLILMPVVAAALLPERTKALRGSLPRFALIAGPSLLCIPYVLVASSFGILHVGWLVVYALLPVAIAALLDRARDADVNRAANWRDFAVLAGLGLAVDLRWLEPAWPAGLAALGKMLLLDAGIFGFLIVRQLQGVGFDLRLHASDAVVGMREFCAYAIIAVPLGLGLGFLHFHAQWASPLRFAGDFLFTFLFIAIPEELFFRGWLQNLLERRVGRSLSLAATAVLFGLAHWNKRTAAFNWRYVLMAAIAGIFYGRAWRAQRRVGASALTHTCVDTFWSIWLR
jgi:membrane protease YdiL (CAAX protease family)